MNSTHYSSQWGEVFFEGTFGLRFLSCGVDHMTYFKVRKEMTVGKLLSFKMTTFFTQDPGPFFEFAKRSYMYHFFILNEHYIYSKKCKWSTRDFSHGLDFRPP